jgi:hypothetical protein
MEENARFLLENGADVNARNDNLGTPLHDACLAPHRPVVELLIEWGADPRIRNNDNNTPLDFYRPEWDHRMAILRVTYPIHWKIRDHLDDEVKHMIQEGVDVNFLDNDLGRPLHTAIEEGRLDLSLWLMRQGADIKALDKLQKTPFDFFRNKDERNQFLIETEYDYEMLTMNSNALWFYFIQEESLPGVVERVRQYVSEYPLLADVCDNHGRSAVNMACAEAKHVILATFLWFDRYRLIDSRPEHTSATCFVYKALDEMDLDEQRKPKKVALKLMREKSQFVRELETRESQFRSECVVGIIRTHPTIRGKAVRSPGPMRDTARTPSEDEDGFNIDCNGILDILEGYPDHVTTRADSTHTGGGLSKKQAEELFCLVMPLADRNLYVALKQERFAGGHNMHIIKHVFKQLVRAVDHMHGKGVIHADIKSLNILRTDSHWKLVDLDAACRVGIDFVGSKSSSAYVPPEAVYTARESDLACVLSQPNMKMILENVKYRAPVELLVADKSFDIWSLGETENVHQRVCIHVYRYGLHVK